MPDRMDRPRHPWWALALLVPAPSVGAAAAMWWWPGTALGQTIFTASKIWLFALPLAWHRWVDGGRWSWSPPSKASRGDRSHWTMAVASGLLAGAALVATYLFVAPHLVDLDAAAREIRAVGLDRPALVLAMAAYWILVNSVLEEMVWRWFVVRQGQGALGSSSGAVWLSAAAFTVHHAVALAVYLPPFATALASAGVGLAGAFWGWLYLRSGSVWPPWVSHALVDLAVFGSAYHLLFVR
jgi:membrane protease YdiL (CAAX protease family)